LGDLRSACDPDIDGARVRERLDRPRQPDLVPRDAQREPRALAQLDRDTRLDQPRGAGAREGPKDLAVRDELQALHGVTRRVEADAGFDLGGPGRPQLDVVADFAPRHLELEERTVGHEGPPAAYTFEPTFVGERSLDAGVETLRAR